MWDTALVLVIVGVCAGVLGRAIYRQLKGKSSCGGGCSGCGTQQEIRPHQPQSGGNGCPKDDAGD